jgi:hypothetical protein
MLEMKELYELAINDFLAVHAMLPVIEVSDTPGQYVLSSQDIRFEPNMEYSAMWARMDDWKAAPHHKRGPVAYFLERIGRLWDHLVVSAVLRDRHLPPTCRAFLTWGVI